MFSLPGIILGFLAEAAPRFIKGDKGFGSHPGSAVPTLRGALRL
jgi:hypothetical protein